MRSYLLFRLYGPLCAWGDIAVGEYRPGSSHPTRSGILGLVAAALGIRRDDTGRMTALFESVRCAVRIDKAGVLLTDYHTSQVPSSGSGRNAQTFDTRRDELLAVPAHKLNTILSKRDYLCDAVFTVALWIDGETTLWTLEEIADKLRRPVFTLYLGRKSCPPALPLAPVVREAATLRDALAMKCFRDEAEPDTDEGKAMRLLLRPLQSRDTERQVYFDEMKDRTETGMNIHHSFTRRDDPGSRTRRQFGVRQELHSTVTVATGKEE